MNYTTPRHFLVTHDVMASVTLPTTEECIAAGEAAHEVVRKYFVQLCSAITSSDVLCHLYANNLIDQVTFERYVETGSGLTTTEKGRLVVLQVQRSVSRGVNVGAGSEITKLCKILRDERDQALNELAKAIEGMW